MSQIMDSVKTIEYFELERCEMHSEERIVKQDEYTPIQFYENLVNKTIKKYDNLVISENKKIPHMIPTIRKWKTIGDAIQILGVILVAIFVLSLNGERLKGRIASIIVVLILQLIVGRLVKVIGRKPFGEYTLCWKKTLPHMDIRELDDGKLAITKYMKRDETAGNYEDIITNEKQQSIVKYTYIIDKVISCERVKDGIMLESAGKFYGLRAVRLTTGEGATDYKDGYAFTEVKVDYRREIIPCIFANMDELYCSLT